MRLTAAALSFAVCLGLAVGCAPKIEQKPNTALKPVVPEGEVDPQLKKLIDDQLEFTIQSRLLNAKEQAAWQVIHGALAYGFDFPLQVGDKKVKAIEYLTNGGALKGWVLKTGDALDDSGKRFGIKAPIEQGSLSGQGHYDQWLGYLCGLNLPLDMKIVVEGQDRTLADYLAQVERDVHLNGDQEYSWTLMAITAYHPTDYKWKAGDGSEWDVPKLIDIELSHDILSSACGGMHRLCGLTMARNRHRDSGGKMEGAWERVDTFIKQSLAKVHEFQNEDGSLSANFLAKPGVSKDLPNAMHAVGHTLEFVILASTDEDLKQPWIQDAVRKLCELFRKTQSLDMECGALYHAAHGLILYRERMFGPRSYIETAEMKPATAAPAAE